MTMPTWLRNALRAMYPTCFTHKAPENIVYHAVSVDMMQYLKQPMHGCNTTRKVIAYLTRILRSLLDRHMVVSMHFDVGGLGPKSAVAHVTRHDLRCGVCKKEHPGVPATRFSDDCVRNCTGRRRLAHGDGPHLPDDLDRPFAWETDDWIRFASDSRNLSDELYPRLVNALLEFVPGPGQQVYLYGLPCHGVNVTESHSLWASASKTALACGTARRILTPWSIAKDLPLGARGHRASDPDLFARVFVIEGVPPCAEWPRGMVRRYEDPTLLNHIHEADNSVFHFPRVKPNLNHMTIINDGDAIPIGLLYTAEIRCDAGNQPPRRHHCVRLPDKRKCSFNKFEYVNLNLLYHNISNDPRFTHANVSNPVASVVFLIVACGTDFFRGVCHGVGKKTAWSDDEKKRKRQTQGVWDVFFDNLSFFSHMVQWNIDAMIKSEYKARTIVVDEDAFCRFIEFCYVAKYGARAIKRYKVDAPATAALVTRYTKTLKNPAYHFPSRDHVMVQCRNIQWNLAYWVNAFRNIFPDPLEVYEGGSYYGFEVCPTTNRVMLSKRVSAAKPQDEVYAMNFLASRERARDNRLKRKRRVDAMPVERRTLAWSLDCIRGE